MCAQRIAHPILWLELRLACEIINEFMLLKYVRIIGFTYALVTQFHFMCMRVEYTLAMYVVCFEFTPLFPLSSELFAVLCKYCAVVKRMLYRVLYLNYV